MSDTEKNNKVRPLSVFLRESRMRAGLSQAQVARRLKYGTAQFISNWERGVSEPPLKAIKILAKIYNIPAEEIFEVVLRTTLEKVKEDLTAKFRDAK
ncbi:MAG: helix-turn-helix transcriptional regulator [Bdellovibrionales bacterium]|nr:helix-turn-helix transcriptional regulator [Bdellovibrionales bacterium]